MISGLMLQVLGFLSTGLMYPNYQGFVPITDAMDQQQVAVVQQEVIAEQQAHDEEQKNILINDYFIFAERIGKILYARGCAGKVNCGPRSYDCGGAMKAYLIAKGLISLDQLSLFNSETLYGLGQPKDPRQGKKGDFMYWKGFGDAETGTLSTHFSVLASDYTGGNTMDIFDQVNPGGPEMFSRRTLNIYCNSSLCYYMGKYRIRLADNGAIALAKQTHKEVLPRFYTGDTAPQSGNAQVTIKGGTVQQDKIATYLYHKSSGDVDMLATFMCESHFNPQALGKLGEKGICQLLPQRTNNVRINNPLWKKSRQFQATACVDKYQAVPIKAKQRSCYNMRKQFLSSIQIK